MLTQLTEMFAENSGYDVGDLEPDFELEADLGIDTVKQAEIFSIIRERYSLAKDEEFKLSEVQTLNAVVEYVIGRMDVSTAPSAASETATTAQTEPAAATTTDSVGAAGVDRGAMLAQLTEMFAENSGYEVSDLEPDFELEADLGIDTVKQAEIFSMIRERYSLAKDEEFKLSEVQTLNAVVEYVISRMDVSEDATTTVTEATPSQGPEADRGTMLNQLTQMFAENSGYEVSDLEPDFELEADLGIDTVKQAEIFSMIRERYSLAKDEEFKLSEVQTLNAVVDYVIGRMDPSKSTPVPVAPKPTATESSGSTIETAVAQAAASAPIPHGLETGAVPMPTWDTRKAFAVAPVVTVALGQTSEAVRQLQNRRVVVAGGTEQVRKELRSQLTDAGAQVHMLEQGMELHKLEALFENIGGAPADDLVFIADAVETADAATIEPQVGALFTTARAFARGRRSMSGAGLLVLGNSKGVFGFGSDDPQGYLMGSLAGSVKALSKEWDGARCIIVDGQADHDAITLARAGLSEWLSDGPIEVAYHQGGRWSLRRGESDQRQVQQKPLVPGDVVVATGGARGVTFSILEKLAAQCSLRFVILARTEGVEPEASPLYGKSTAEQKELAKASISVAGERVTPAAVNRWIARQEAKVEVARNLQRLRDLGSESDLLACDVSTSEAVTAVAAKISERFGQVALLIHGAGVEESKMLVDKDLDAFARIFAPKARALLNLHDAIKPAHVLTMGSVSGRFGNGGQVDYSAANELMASLARHQNSRFTNLAWTAWGDVGMATRGSIRKVLESVGVELLPAELGAQIGADIALRRISGDFVVAGKLGQFGATEPDGEETAIGMAGPESAAIEELPPLFDRAEGSDGEHVYIRNLDAQRDVGLDHHRIEGVVVLPGVLGVEMMTQAAEHLMGATATALHGVKFESPFKLHRDAPMDARVEVTKNGDRAQVALISIFVGPGGKQLRRPHFSCEVSFGGERNPVTPVPGRLEIPRKPSITRSDIYRRYFHGPTFQVLATVDTLGDNGVVAQPMGDLPPWVQGVEQVQFHSVPFWREAGFQAAGIWEMAEVGRMALPAGIEHVELGATPPTDAQLRIEVRRRSVGSDGSVFDVGLVDSEGNIYDVMRGYRTAKLRDLAPSDRFEPSKASGTVPSWLTVNLSEVQSMLDNEREASLSQYLSHEERAKFDGLKTDKRRLEWFAGRIAAKRLLREVKFGNEEAIVPYGAITILADELGAPSVRIVGEPEAFQQISISHSAGVAAAFFSSDQSVRPGIDVEKVEQRDPSFAQSYFSDGERATAWVSGDSDRTFTSMWAVKEAILKALGIGARVDLREVIALERNGRWHVTLQGEAQKRAEAIGAGTPQIEIEHDGDRVVARVLLPITNPDAANAGKPEASA
jgi:phosphopantetheine--protein transferase-like protein